jgi:hypothetical protein
MHVMIMLQIAEVSLVSHIIVGSFAQEMKSEGNAAIRSGDLFGSELRAYKALECVRNGCSKDKG